MVHRTDGKKYQSLVFGKHNYSVELLVRLAYCVRCGGNDIVVHRASLMGIWAIGIVCGC